MKEKAIWTNEDWGKVFKLLLSILLIIIYFVPMFWAVHVMVTKVFKLEGVDAAAVFFTSWIIIRPFRRFAKIKGPIE